MKKLWFCNNESIFGKIKYISEYLSIYIYKKTFILSHCIKKNGLLFYILYGPKYYDTLSLKYRLGIYKKLLKMYIRKITK